MNQVIRELIEKYTIRHGYVSETKDLAVVNKDEYFAQDIQTRKGIDDVLKYEHDALVRELVEIEQERRAHLKEEKKYKNVFLVGDKVCVVDFRKPVYQQCKEQADGAVSVEEIMMALGSEGAKKEFNIKTKEDQDREDFLEYTIVEQEISQDRTHAYVVLKNRYTEETIKVEELIENGLHVCYPSTFANFNIHHASLWSGLEKDATVWLYRNGLLKEQKH